MNILLVNPWDQTHGGVAAVVNNLAHQLQAHGHGVSFFYKQTNSFVLREGKTKLGFRQFRMSFLLPFGGKISFQGSLAGIVLFPLALLQVLALIRRERIDIINIHYPRGGDVLFAICRMLFPVRLVTSVHGADFFPGGQARNAYSKPLRYVLSRSDAIVANSRAFQEDFLSLFPDLRAKTTIIHNGVDLQELNSSKPNQVSDANPYVVCVAAHNEKKALDVLIRAFARVLRVNERVKLVLVGDGPLRQALEGLAASLGLSEWVVFAGEKGRNDVMLLLHGCTLAVLPSRSEPFGIAVVEAMGCGKPVVASRTGGIPEIVTDGVDGLLVEPNDAEALADAILRMLGDGELRSRLGAAARVTVRNRFLWEHTGYRYRELYARLCSV